MNIYMLNQKFMKNPTKEIKFNQKNEQLMKQNLLLKETSQNFEKSIEILKIKLNESMTSQNDLKDEIYIKSILKEVLKDKNIELFEKLQVTKSIPIVF